MQSIVLLPTYRIKGIPDQTCRSITFRFWFKNHGDHLEEHCAFHKSILMRCFPEWTMNIITKYRGDCAKVPKFRSTDAVRLQHPPQQSACILVRWQVDCSYLEFKKPGALKSRTFLSTDMIYYMTSKGQPAYIQTEQKIMVQCTQLCSMHKFI